MADLDADLAARTLERVVAIAPEHSGALESLERVYFNGDQWAELYEVYQKMALEKRDPAGCDQVTDAAVRADLARHAAEDLGRDQRRVLQRLDLIVRAGDDPRHGRRKRKTHVRIFAGCAS